MLERKEEKRREERERRERERDKKETLVLFYNELLLFFPFSFFPSDFKIFQKTFFIP